MHKVSAVAQKAPASSASLPRHPALVLFRVEDSGMNSTGHPELSRSLRVGDTAGPLNYDRGPTFGDGRQHKPPHQERAKIPLLRMT
jgi:hypothetical protein